MLSMCFCTIGFCAKIYPFNVYILHIFSLVFFQVCRWPPTLTNRHTSKRSPAPIKFPRLSCTPPSLKPIQKGKRGTMSSVHSAARVEPLLKLNACWDSSPQPSSTIACFLRFIPQRPDLLWNGFGSRWS